MRALDEQVSDAPARAFPDLDDLVARMLAEHNCSRGIDTNSSQTRMSILGIVDDEGGG